MGGLGLLATLLAVALLWGQQRAIAGAALVVAALEAGLVGRELARRWRGEIPPNRWIGPLPIALLVGLLFLLAALVG